MSSSDPLTQAAAAARRARPPAPRVASAEVHAFAPALGWYSDNILFGESWNRSELSKRDRSLVTVSALVAGAHTAQMTGHFNRALTNGLLPTEIVEVITHLAFYCGWPCSMSAVAVMRQVFGERGIAPEQLVSRVGMDLPTDDTDDEPPAQPVPGAVRALTPALAEFTENVVSANLWRRAGLSLRDRSLATITALIATGQLDHLAAHAHRGLDNGLTQTEISESVTHLSFYVGWPKAISAASAVAAAFENAA